MFKLASLTAICVFATTANAATYECDNIADVEEWRVSIDTEEGVADFFDNDTTYYMSLVETLSLESYPPQTQYKFEGEGTQLIFNETRLTASVYNITDSGLSLIGSTESCSEVK